MKRCATAAAAAALLILACAPASAQAPEWKAVDSGAAATLRAVSFAGKDDVWAVGDKGTVLKSANAGETWAAVKTPSDGTLRGTHWLDKDHGCVVGDGDSDAPQVTRGHMLFGKPLKCGTFLFTVDGGKTWDRAFIQMNFELRAVWMASEKVGQICNHGGSGHPDGDAVVTFDGSRGWRSGRVFRGLNGCFWLDEQTAWAVGSRVSVGFFPAPTSPLYTQKAARIISSTDGGKTWNPVDSPASPGELRGIRFADRNTGVAVGDRGAIQRTTDSGKTWNAVATDVSGNLHAVAFADAKHGWAVGAGGIIIETTDAGETWKPMASPTQKNLFGLHASGPVAVAVGADGTIIRLK